VGGGRCNTASGTYSTVVGGFSSRAIGPYSIVNGRCNSASGCYSGVFGGQNNTIKSALSASFIIGTGITALSANTTYVNSFEIIPDTNPSYIYLKSPNGTRYKINVADGGCSLTITAAQ
jgi:hypothetical protein